MANVDHDLATHAIATRCPVLFSQCLPPYIILRSVTLEYQLVVEMS